MSVTSLAPHPVTGHPLAWARDLALLGGGSSAAGKLARCDTKVNPIRHNISARHTRVPDIRRLFGCPLTP